MTRSLPVTANLLRASIPLCTRSELTLLGFAVAALLARTLVTGRPTFAFICWNLLLAWLPLATLWVVDRVATPGSRGWWGALAVWLALLPNAPYLVTDLKYPYAGLLGPGAVQLGGYLSLLVVAPAAVLGLCWYVRAVGEVGERLFELGWSRGRREGFAAAVAVASACGVWLGRSLRFNSWDVLVRPLEVATEGWTFLAAPRHAEWVLATALALWGLHRVARAFSKLGLLLDLRLRD